MLYISDWFKWHKVMDWYMKRSSPEDILVYNPYIT